MGLHKAHTKKCNVIHKLFLSVPKEASLLPFNMRFENPFKGSNCHIFQCFKYAVLDLVESILMVVFMSQFWRKHFRIYYVFVFRLYPLVSNWQFAFKNGKKHLLI